MSPIQAARVSHDADSQSTFEQDLVWHMHNAYVWSGEDAFIMGRPMPKSKLESEAASRTTYQISDCDTWFVWRGAGKAPLKRFLEVAPFKLPFVAWHRKGDRLKVYSWDIYERKVKKYGNKN
jgi:hypothetical protein